VMAIVSGGSCAYYLMGFSARARPISLRNTAQAVPARRAEVMVESSISPTANDERREAATGSSSLTRARRSRLRRGCTPVTAWQSERCAASEDGLGALRPVEPNADETTQTTPCA
jgi:hypothetical protein